MLLALRFLNSVRRVEGAVRRLKHPASRNLYLQADAEADKQRSEEDADEREARALQET